MNTPIEYAGSVRLRPAVDVVASELASDLRARGIDPDVAMVLVDRRLTSARILYAAYAHGDPLPGVEPLAWEQLSAIEVRRWVAVARATGA